MRPKASQAIDSEPVLAGGIIIILTHGTNQQLEALVMIFQLSTLKGKRNTVSISRLAKTIDIATYSNFVSRFQIQLHYTLQIAIFLINPSLI